MSQARYAVEVLAGLIPGVPMPEFTQRWIVSSTEWARGAAEPNVGMTGPESPWAQAVQYAAEIVKPAPSAPNWVRIEWVWF